MNIAKPLDNQIVSHILNESKKLELDIRISGGAVICPLLGQPVKDIDVYIFANDPTFYNVIKNQFYNFVLNPECEATEITDNYIKNNVNKAWRTTWNNTQIDLMIGPNHEFDIMGCEIFLNNKGYSGNGIDNFLIFPSNGYSLRSKNFSRIEKYILRGMPLWEKMNEFLWKYEIAKTSNTSMCYSTIKPSNPILSGFLLDGISNIPDEYQELIYKRISPEEIYNYNLAWNNVKSTIKFNNPKDTIMDCLHDKLMRVVIKSCLDGEKMQSAVYKTDRAF